MTAEGSAEKPAVSSIENLVESLAGNFAEKSAEKSAANAVENLAASSVRNPAE